MAPSGLFMSHLVAQLRYSAGEGSFGFCNWLPLRRLVWINHLPLVYLSTFWKSTFKQQFGCRFDMMDCISQFLFNLIYEIIFVLIHRKSFRLYHYFLNIFFFSFLSSTLVLTVSIDVVSIFPMLFHIIISFIKVFHSFNKFWLVL